MYRYIETHRSDIDALSKQKYASTFIEKKERKKNRDDVYIYLHVITHMYLCISVSKCVCARVYMYVCVYICVYVSLCEVGAKFANFSV